jgi:hypothetical protein
MSNNKGLLLKNKILKFPSPQSRKSNLLNANNKSSSLFSKKVSNNNTRNKILYDQTKKSVNNSYINGNKYFRAKTFQLESNKGEESKNEDLACYKSTFIRDFRSYENYPINTIFQHKKSGNQKLYWFVAYDKLMKTKNVIKILNYNNKNFNDKYKSNSSTICSESYLKIKTLKIPNYEMFFVKGYDRPFVRPNKNSFIYGKLYLLSKDEINKILNYINRIEQKIDIDKYLPSIKQTICQYIDFSNNSDNNTDIYYPYCYIYYLGKFMNISMFLFTNTFYYLKLYNINNNIIYSLPSTKKLFKLVKTIIKYFPEDKPESIINNIIKIDLYSNSFEMKNNVMKKLSILIKHSAPNKLLLNKILRETITGIQTNSSISVSPLIYDSSEQLNSSKKGKFQQENCCNFRNNTDDLKNDAIKGYKFEFKNSFNSLNNLFLNGPNITNNLSTNHTILPSNSIRTYSNKNSILFNIPLLSMSSKINNIRKNRQRLFCLTSKNIDNLDSLNLNQDNKKKLNKKLFINKEKENLDITNILNKKKEENNDANKLNNNNNNNNNGCHKKKKNDKNNRTKDDKQNKYTTPKKTKKIKYYG